MMDFEELVKRLSPKLNAITHKLNGKFRFFNEDDLYQEATLELWKKYSNGQLTDKTDSFVVQGCFFFLKNYIRKTYKKIDSNSIRLSEIINTDNNSGDDFGDVFSLEDKTNERGNLEGKLLKEELDNILNEREKEILNLCLEELTTRDIGKKMGLSHVMIIKIEKKIREKCQKFKEDFF